MSTPITTRSYDIYRSGTNNSETILTPQLVKTKGIEKLFTVALPGDAGGAEAQPLLVPQVGTNDGVTRDLLIVATMANMLFAFDANTGDPIWSQRIGNPILGSTKIDMYKINTHWGILSTPVINDDVIYSVVWTSSDGTWQNGKFFLHANSVIDGSTIETPLSLEVATHIPGHGLPNRIFSDTERKQRSSLLLNTYTDITGTVHPTIFFGAGSIFESVNNLGWLIAIDIPSWSIAAALTTCPNQGGGGIWQGGQGVACDQDGFIYFLTGNGSFDGVTDFGECICKVQYTPPTGTVAGSLAMVDWFSPFLDDDRDGDSTDEDRLEWESNINPTNLQRTPSSPAATNMNGWNDQDLGSAGALVIPDLNFVIGSGKDGILYVCNRHNLGKPTIVQIHSATNYALLASPPIWFTYYNPTTSPEPALSVDLNILYANRTHHMHSTPVHYKDNVHGDMLFCWGENGCLRSWTINAAGKVTYLGTSQEIASMNAAIPPGGMPGGMISLSANNGTNAILWACVPYLDANKVISPGRLIAYDATNLGKLPDGEGWLQKIWDSQDWNIQFSHNKFNIPVVSGGKVYVPTYDGTIDVYGLV